MDQLTIANGRLAMIRLAMDCIDDEPDELTPAEQIQHALDCPDSEVEAFINVMEENYRDQQD